MDSQKRHWISYLSKNDEAEGEAVERDASHAVAEQDVVVTDAPSAQAMIDLIPSWTSALPDEAGVRAGGAALFNDGRCVWAMQQLGGVEGRTVLELGPLEGGHAYMLQLAGASEVVSIEANRLCYMKCLIVKEILGMDRVRFLLGNFTPWLDQYKGRFDVAWVAGVLYHMADPIRLLRQVARLTDRIYLWTHFVPDAGFGPDDAWSSLILRAEDRDVGDRVVRHYIRTYNDQGKNPAYCGGIYMSAAWLPRGEILRELELQGFTRIETSLEVLDHPHGPCISIAASRS